MNFDVIEPYKRGVYFMFFIHLFLLAVYLIYKGKKSSHQEYTLLGAALIIFPTVHFIYGYLLTSDFLNLKGTLRQVFSFSAVLMLAIAPLLYLSLKIVLKEEESLNLKKNWKYFSVLFLMMLLEAPYVFYYYKTGVLSSWHYASIVYGVFVSQNLVYSVMALLFIRRHTESDDTAAVLKLIRTFVYTFLVYLPTRLALIFVRHFSSVEESVFDVIQLIVFLFIIYMIVLGIVEYRREKKRLKYEKSVMSTDMEDHLFQTIKDYFQSEKQHLENDFTLLKLSQGLDISQKKISQAINSKSGTNFNDFVNSYRLEESTVLLSEKSKSELSISEVYYMVGFNSRSTFNTLFKKTYGQTPSAYRQLNAK